MKVSTKGRYAVRAITRLAKHNSKGPLSIKEIAEKEEISPVFLEQLFFKLKKKEIISSVRGPGGGFTLNFDPKKLNIKIILDAVGEGIWFAPCNLDPNDPNYCNKAGTCTTNCIWKEAYNQIKKYFESISIQDVINKDIKNKFEA